MAQLQEDKATIVELKPMRVIACPHKGAYHEIGAAFDKLFGWAGPAGIPVGGAVGVYYDDPGTTPVAELRSAACAIVPDDFQLADTGGHPFHLDTIEGGRFAKATHMGPYEGLGQAWKEFCDVQIPALGVEFRHAPSFEIYVNDCNEVAPEDVQTDLYVPIK